MHRAENELQGKESNFAFFGSRPLVSFTVSQERHERATSRTKQSMGGPLVQSHG